MDIAERLGNVLFFIAAFVLIIIINTVSYLWDALKFIYKIFFPAPPKKQEKNPVCTHIPKTGLEKLYEKYQDEFADAADSIENESVYSVIEIPEPLKFIKFEERVTICALENTKEEIIEAFKKPLKAHHYLLKDYLIVSMNQGYVDDLLIPIVGLDELVKFLEDNPMKLQRAFQKPIGYCGEIYVKFSEAEIQDMMNKRGHGMLPFMSDWNYDRKLGPRINLDGLPNKKK